MTRWEEAKLSILAAALEKCGTITGAAKFLGLSPRCVRHHVRSNPILENYLPKEVLEESYRRREGQRRSIEEKNADDPNECHELRPISWVPQWYKDKYPSIFKDEQ